MSPTAKSHQHRQRASAYLRTLYGRGVQHRAAHLARRQVTALHDACTEVDQHRYRFGDGLRSQEKRFHGEKNTAPV